MPVTAVRRVGRAVVLVQVQSTVSVEEWAERLEEMLQIDLHPDVNVLVGWSDGHLNARQRQMTSDMQARLATLGRRAPRALVFTDSRLSRGVITAMGWYIDVNARAFTKASLVEVLIAEGFTPAQADELQQTITSMVTELNRTSSPQP